MTDASFHKELARGDVLDGAYRIVRLIAEGGMGHVYEAEQIRLDRRVALKVLSIDPRKSREFLPRFRREAEICAKLSHPHIIAVLDWNVSDGMPYLVMEFLDGEDLGIRLSRGPASIDETLYVIDGIAQGLTAAHAHGIVHRDLKPSNVYLCEVGGTRPHVKLLDFGVSKVTWETTLSTTSPKVLGSPRYMAPEQARGDPNVDARIDQFALGTVAYEMLSGQFAFDGDSLTTVLYRVVHEPPPPLASRVSNVPEHMLRAIERAMEKDASKRFESVAQFVDALHGRIPADVAHKAADRTSAFGAAPTATAPTPAVLTPVERPAPPAPATVPFSHGTQPITPAGATEARPPVSPATVPVTHVPVKSKTNTVAAVGLAVVAIVAAGVIWWTNQNAKTVEPSGTTSPIAADPAATPPPVTPAATTKPTDPASPNAPGEPPAPPPPPPTAGTEPARTPETSAKPAAEPPVARTPKKTVTRAESDAAKKLIDDAQKLYNAGDYRTAVVRGKQALGYDNAPRAHRIIALSYCALGSLGDVRAELFEVAAADKPAIIKACAARGIDIR